MKWLMIVLGIVPGARLVAFIIFGRRAQNVYPRPRARPVPRPGHWTTCAASGG